MTLGWVQEEPVLKPASWDWASAGSTAAARTLGVVERTGAQDHEASGSSDFDTGRCDAQKNPPSVLKMLLGTPILAVE